ncbi:MAG: LysR family transcriptional regulator [Bdellovibrionota bacterium]
MSLISQLNINQLRIFELVYRERSMTAAARLLGMTKSGASQHIHALEGMIGIPLFDRIGKRLVPTEQARILYSACHDSFERIDEALDQVTDKTRTLRGQVSLGLPIEFGNNVVVPLLAKFIRENPGISLSLAYGFVTEMSRRMLDGELDFSFIDAFELDARFVTRKIYDERLELCASKDYLAALKSGPRIHDRAFYERLDYVDYQAGGPLVKFWFGGQFGGEGGSGRSFAPKIRVHAMDVQGVAKLILGGVGAGVLPVHLISQLGPAKLKLVALPGKGKAVTNEIRVAALKDRKLSLAATRARDWLEAGISALGMHRKSR